METCKNVLNLSLFSYFYLCLQWRVPITRAQISLQTRRKHKQQQSKENVELTISAAASLKDAMDVIQHTYRR